MSPSIDSADLAVSLVIPTHNRAESLARTLKAVEKLDFAGEMTLEVTIVLDGCSDLSAAVVEKVRKESKHRVTAVETKGLGAGGARNTGIQHSSGFLIGFIDDDVIPEASWLEKHRVCHASQKTPKVTIGAMALPSFMRLPAWNEWEVLSLQARYAELSFGRAQAEPTDFYTANAMVPREALMAVGGFDESLSRAEDVELAERLAEFGVQFEFLSDVTVAHCPVRSLGNWKKIPVNYAKSHNEMQNSADNEALKDVGAPRLDNMHGLTRLAVKLFSKQKISSDIYCFFAQLIGRIAHAAGMSKISYAAFSSVYNVLYFGALHRIRLNSTEPNRE